MAVVDTLGLSDYSVYNKKDPPNLAPNIDVIGRVGVARDHYLYSADSYAPVAINNTPIPLEPQALMVPGAFKLHTFADDYYNRIHLLPSVLALGNLLSTQVRTVEVWSSYNTPQLLSSISETDTDGITLTEPVSPPTFFEALESRNYDLNIAVNGPPVINASYAFNFTSDTPVLSVTGRRVVVWPFMPQTKHKESLEWRTDIISSYNNEQRLALRSEPRQAFAYNYQLDEQQFSRSKAIMNQWAQRVFSVPVWSELTYVGQILPEATAIFFDTTYADYRADDIILIWQSDTKFLAVETEVVLADRINLKLPLGDSFTNAYVAPLRFARALQGTKYQRDSNSYSLAKVTFVVTQNTDLATTGEYDNYRSKDVIPQQTILIGNLSEHISRQMDVFDNGSGPVEVDLTKNWVNFTQQMSFDSLNRQERWVARQWIHSRRGKQKSFWLPSWNKDLISLVDVSSTSTSLTCSPVGYPLYYGIKDIMIQLKDGARVYNRILGATTDGDGNEILSLENVIGVELPVVAISFICFMSHARFNTDKVQFNHSYEGRATTSIAVTEVPE